MSKKIMLGGTPAYIFDLSTERDAPRSYTERIPTFTERALEEAKECTKADLKHKFFTVYSENCADMTSFDPERLLRLSLVGQSYVYSKHRKRVLMASCIMVFYQNNGKFVPLWKFNSLQCNQSYPFLSPITLQQQMETIFSSVKLTLGSLTVKDIPCIAWKVETNEGNFYIPWHNGCIIEEKEDFLFEEKQLNEMKKIYTLLRFAPNYDQTSYKVTCC